MAPAWLLIESGMPRSRRSSSAPKGPRRRAHRTSGEAPIKTLEDAILRFFRARVDPDALDRLKLFESADLAMREREILEGIIDSTNVVRASRLPELLRKLDRVANMLAELLSLGISPTDVLESVDLPIAECEHACLEYLRDLRRRLGQERTGLRSVIRHVDHLLPETTQVRMDLSAIVKGELDRTAPAYTVIKKVLANGSAVLRQTRNPLVQVPPVNLLRLLLSHGIPKTEACGLTARFLTRWEPDRFRGLQADHVRRRYERLGGSRRPG